MWGSSRGDSHGCREFSHLSPKPKVVFGGLFSDQFQYPTPTVEVLQQRMRAVVRHQNELRQKAGIPVIDPAEEPMYSPTLFDDRIVRIGYRSAGNATASAANFLSFGNVILRSTFQDNHALNFVYTFDGVNLVKSEPLSSYLISHSQTDPIKLYRNMGAKERKLWLSSDLDNLRAHGVKWGYKESVLHFTMGRPTPSMASQSPNESVLTWSVPRKQLEVLARQGMVEAGGLATSKDEDVFVFELVLKEPAWHEAMKWKLESVK